MQVETMLSFPGAEEISHPGWGLLSVVVVILPEVHIRQKTLRLVRDLSWSEDRIMSRLVGFQRLAEDTAT